MKLMIEISEETKKNIGWYGLHLCPRDENNEYGELVVVFD